MKLMPSLAVVAAFGAVLTGQAALAAESPFVGTWVFDFAKSKVSPAFAQASYTIVVTRLGGGQWKSATEASIGGAPPSHTEVVFAFDNHSYAPVSKPGETTNAMGITETFQHVNDNTIKMIMKVKDQTVDTLTNTVSADGKTLTVSHSTAGPDGTLPVEVFDRK